MTSGHGIRLFFQAIYFIFVARALGATSYGAFVGAVSLVAILAPFSSWGMGFILIKEVARCREAFNGYWGTALVLTIISGSALLCIVLVVSQLIWGNAIPIKLVFLIGFSDIIVVRVVDLAAQAFAAVESLRQSAQVYVVLSIARAASAMYLFFFVHPPTAFAWAWLYFFSATAAAMYSILSVTKSIGPPLVGLRFLRGQIKEGFYFAVSQASLTVHNDIDKTMLVRFAGLGATGIYGAAYRIIDVSFAPISALVYSSLARFFRHGKSGIVESARFARALITYAAAYGAIAALVLLLAAPVLAVFLGHDFANASVALRWLSPLILIRAIHYFLANSLSGAGYQGSRTLVQLGIVGMNVLLNLWLIPQYSWRGAAWASLVSDAALALALVWMVRFWESRSTQTQNVPALQPGVL
jgi:O-antigen/teichoic acid export membrane protein